MLFEPDTVSLASLLDGLGYNDSPFFVERANDAELGVAHLLRDAERAQVRGTYFIRTTAENAMTRRERPAVQVAQATTVDEARTIHRHLWNQGATPFLLVSLPGQVRVYTPFAYDVTNERIGQVEKPIDTHLGLRRVVERLNFLRAAAIDSGEIWRTKGTSLTRHTRVDRKLIETLRILSRRLIRRYHLKREVAHALVGRFVYLHYLRERDILSDTWLGSVGVEPESIFSSNVHLKSFRLLTEAVDMRFNGRIFPIDWSLNSAPTAEAVAAAGKAFSGESNGGQVPLFKPFDFSYIPIELLSSIYEQFLHDEGQGAKQGAFYTSEPVADYLISEVEAEKPIKQGMRILDPCCGSGIFLVLAFRRLVERELRARKTTSLLPTELRQILTKSIFGVEREPEACLVAEFSLILTLLSYVDPPELHSHTNFKFPTLHNRQIFEADFFDDNSSFWQLDQRYDWIIGNPPWVEHDPGDVKEKPLISWIERHPDLPVSRFRSGEAFTWRVRDRVADDGVVGLITQATSLTNDQSAEYRKAFFARNAVHRITNFSNLAYVLFESADEPAADIIYSAHVNEQAKPDIIHFGPLVANQPAMAVTNRRRKRAPWVLNVGESEIQIISADDAELGQATTWKRALWGTARDERVLNRLRRVFPKTLEQLVDERDWALNLGIQLRRSKGTSRDPNFDVFTIMTNRGDDEQSAKTYAKWFEGLKVTEPKQPSKAPRRLTVPKQWLVDNDWGTFIRERGGTEGLKIIPAPHLFLWNEYAALSDTPSIFRHPRIGVAAPPNDRDWLKAVSVIWTSSITRYYLFLELSAGWGISRSTIDLGDARRMPMPDLDRDIVSQLSSLHTELAAKETHLKDRQDWQRQLDERLASILSIPSQIMLVAREFSEFRLPLVKGQAPRHLTRAPDTPQLTKYARRLKAELDGFMERNDRHHNVIVRTSDVGAVASIEIAHNGGRGTAIVIEAEPGHSSTARDILNAASQQYGQWVYVQRSVRVFSGNTIHLCKPARRLEWTETQALLDCADIIAEVAESRLLAKHGTTHQ